jgi:D-alanine-D-alanine ligase-like ATP-grasp enzyme
MADKRLRVGVVFGGRSGEHEVSQASGIPYPELISRLIALALERR